MAYQTIEFAVDQGIATLTMNRPARGNAVDLVMRQEIPDAIARVRSDHDIRALILTGAGGHFCAGGDIASMQGAIPDAAAGRNRLQVHIGWVEDLVMLDRPVIAAVDGNAAGAGCNMALAADFILATPAARFRRATASARISPAVCRRR